MTTTITQGKKLLILNSTEHESKVLFFCSPTCDYELKRSSIKKLDVIGEGQFGDVCRGLYYFDYDKDPIEVAIKTCKADGDSSMSDKFLEEACKNSRSTAYIDIFSCT